MEFPEPSHEEELPPMLQERFLQTRTILLYGELNQDLVQNASQQLLVLASLSNDPIQVLVNAQGEQFDPGAALFDLIQSVPPRVMTIGSGAVGGSAILPFLAPRQQDRFCLPNARFLLHQPVTNLAGGIENVASGAQAAADQYNRVNEIIARQTGQRLDKIEQDTRRAFWMSAQEALRYGLVGRIIHSIHEAGRETR